MAKHRLASIAAAIALASAPLAARAGISTLYGDQVHVDLLTIASGGFETPDAIASEAVEFSRFFSPFATVSVNILPNSFALLYEGTDQIDPGGFNLGLVGFDLSDLDFADGGVILGVQQLGSSWPVDAFEAPTFGPHSISIRLTNDQIIIGANEQWAVTYAIVSPEPGVAATGSIAALALGALRTRRWLRQRPR